jgi:hypothetical protein
MKIKSGGRSKGTPNKITADVRQALQSFIDANIHSVQSQFDELEAKDKLKFITDILPYLVPKLQPTQVSTPPESEDVIITLNLS